MAREKTLVKQCMLELRTSLTPHWVVKLADHFTRGLPDVLAIGKTQSGNLAVLLVECKLPGRRKLRPMQLATQEIIDSLNISESVRYVVVEQVDELREAINEINTTLDGLEW